MQASHMADLLAPFAQLANRHAMAPVYKCIEIGPDYVRGCSQFGIMDAAIKLGIPETVWLEANTFYQVLKSLPGKEEIIFTIKAATLEWECGMSTGKLAILAKQAIPTIEGSKLPESQPWQPTDAFNDALDLGTVACGSIGTASTGVFGVLFDNRADFSILSSDNVTVAACRVSDRVPDFPERVTFNPEAIKLLETVLNGKTEGVSISLDERSLYAVIKDFRLVLRPIPAIRHDLRALLEQFRHGETTTPAPKEQLAGFVKRVTALSENKAAAFVNLAAVDGALSLSFSEGTAAADEYYLVEGLAVPELADIKLDAGRVARALVHIDDLVLDFMDRRVLVLRGKSPEFYYVISGKAE